VVRQIWLSAEQPYGKRLVPILRQWLPATGEFDTEPDLFVLWQIQHQGDSSSTGGAQLTPGEIPVFTGTGQAALM
jgi:hypothetical protein